MILEQLLVLVKILHSVDLKRSKLLILFYSKLCYYSLRKIIEELCSCLVGHILLLYSLSLFGIMSRP